MQLDMVIQPAMTVIKTGCDYDNDDDDDDDCGHESDDELKTCQRSSR